MTFIEKIENEIIKINKLHADGGYIQGKVDALRWVLSELKKMICENCKYHDGCLETIELKDKTEEEEYYHEAIIYCSKWEENENINN